MIESLVALALFGAQAGDVAADNAGVAAARTNAPKEDSPEAIAQDAARDLKDSRFYNKPGATRAQYDSDWQQCRLIARGSRTPAGTIPYFYNPAVVSPLAAGIGGGIGGLIGAAIAEGQQRRANRRECLLVKGWRLVEVPSAIAAKVAAMDDAARSDYFNTIVGASEVQGEVTERNRFSADPALGLELDKPVALPGAVFAGKKVDAAAPVDLAADEALVVMAFRRPDAGSAGRSGQVNLSRYDASANDRIYQPRDWKKKGDKTTYGLVAKSRDKKAPYELHMMKVTAGSYVIDSYSIGAAVPVTTHCFGAPMVDVKPGDIVYLGDFVPLMDAPTKLGTKVSDLVWTSNPADARATLAVKQPVLAERLAPATWRNRATYACAGQTMTRWDLPGMEELPLPESAEVRNVPASAQPPAGTTVIPIPTGS